jgi:hypothetical protein
MSPASHLLRSISCQGQGVTAGHRSADPPGAEGCYTDSFSSLAVNRHRRLTRDRRPKLTHPVELVQVVCRVDPPARQGQLARGRLAPLHLDARTGHAWSLNARREPAVLPNSPGDIGDALSAARLGGNHLEFPFLRVAAQRLTEAFDLPQWVDRPRNSCHHFLIIPGNRACKHSRSCCHDMPGHGLAASLFLRMEVVNPVSGHGLLRQGRRSRKYYRRDCRKSGQKSNHRWISALRRIAVLRELCEDRNPPAVIKRHCNWVGNNLAGAARPTAPRVGLQSRDRRRWFRTALVLVSPLNHLRQAGAPRRRLHRTAAGKQLSYHRASPSGWPRWIGHVHHRKEVTGQTWLGEGAGTTCQRKFCATGATDARV